MNFIIFIIIIFLQQIAFADQAILSKKVLHLTFHRGCAKEFEGVAEELSLDLETWYIPDLPEKFFDGTSAGNTLYNMGHERAERIWNLHRDYFQQFDVILTSDTTPLARIFLQNGFTKKLIIWICNRFDYCDKASLDCDFPDEEYYQLFQQATLLPNVTIIAYTAFEHYYAQSKGINTGNLLITPCATIQQRTDLKFESLIPNHIIKENTFFIPPYHNEILFLDFSQLCSELGIVNYCGRYQGSVDLKDFKGIIHLPYAWSNLALFENISLGIPYFIPSRSFFMSLADRENYFYHDLNTLLEESLLDLSEWYCPENAEVFTYFDSWEDLKFKIENANLEELRKIIQNHSKNHRETMLSRWKSVFFYP